MSDNIKENKTRSFGLTNWSLKNKITVFLATALMAIVGAKSYTSMPKELFPEIVIPTIMVQTVYPGNPPVDIENLITRHIEKEVETIKGVKKVTSTSLQDVSLVVVEFNTNVEVKQAKQDVKDAVDKAKKDLPNDLLEDPSVDDIDFSEFPIININLSGDYSVQELKKYADYLQDRFETLPQVSKAEIKGVEEKEIKVNVDLIKMEAAGLTFNDIEDAIRGENLSMAGGEIKLSKARRSIRIDGEFKNMQDIESIIVKRENDKTVYLKDIAQVINGFEEAKSITRLNGEPVLSIQVVKKSGENLLEATDKVYEILEKEKESSAIPSSLKITTTNDQSDNIRKQIADLENNMLMGVLFVLLVLYYFLGTRNAMMVASAIPLSMIISFIVLKSMGYTINMMVLFSLILALGMLVDNAIVVVENIYRYYSNGYSAFEAARKGTGEIAFPVISSTATTLAAFLPLVFWEGIMGEFMKYLPMTLIVVLSASLFVALVIVPVFAAVYIKVEDKTNFTPEKRKRFYRISYIFFGVAALFYIFKLFAIANILFIIGLVIFLNMLIFRKAQIWFQEEALTRLERFYERAIAFALKGRNPIWMFTGTIGLFIFAFVLLAVRQPKVEFFPQGDPTYINVITELPIGSDLTATDSVMTLIEKDVNAVLAPNRQVVKSVLSTVGKVTRSGDFTPSDMINKGTTTITFVDFVDRHGVSTTQLQQQLTNALVGKYPGVIVNIERAEDGPPVGKPINIEVSGEDFAQLLNLSDSLIGFVNSKRIDGIEGLKIDLEVGKPELLIEIDRDKARRFGLSTAQIGMAVRTALYGKEISKFKEKDEDYPIQLRYSDTYRYNLSSLLNQKIAFKENGKTVLIPLSSVANFKYSDTFGSVKHKDRKRVVTVWSNVIEGYNANDINEQLKMVLSDFKMPTGYEFAFTGEQEEQAESMAFLGSAMLIACALIYLIMVSQFNSVIYPIVIMTTVIFSLIGVIGGIATFKMNFVVIMTGIGVVSLAGVVVNNGIVLIDYILLLRNQKALELGIAEPLDIPRQENLKLIAIAGKTRLRPVLLTAITTLLGLMPMAVGLNIDFVGLFTKFDPNIYFGGDSVAMWGPLSWAIIFGLSFATFLTLIIVPVTYTLVVDIQRKVRRLLGKH